MSAITEYATARSLANQYLKQAKELEDDVQGELVTLKKNNQQTDFGTVYLKPSKRWQYTSKTQALIDGFKAQIKSLQIAEQQGDATFTETYSVSFREKQNDDI